ncbi:TolC family protein [Mariniblastus fucicola]|uniref:TolC family protein n=1 Tax=Mariniblastus fucicola TaxID=980251 RepID=UPI001AEFA56E|nr:TolC family protein [Mariniblastus fucicola]
MQNTETFDRKHDSASTEIGLVDFKQDVANLVGSGETTSNSAVSTAVFNQSADAQQLTLDLVLNRVTECYPEIEIAIGELESANGKTLAAWGEFDSVLSAHSISQPLGFYQTYRNGIGVSQPLAGGGEVYGGYRIGDGNFEPWYGERETNEGGELKAGFSVPILKDRAIDQRRASVRTAELTQDQLSANVESRLLQFERFATQAYWDWIAAGRYVEVQQQLIRLAQTRVSQIETRIEKGDLARIAKIDNDRFIAKRNNGLIKAQREFQKAAIKLSLFFRDSHCQPVVPGRELLPGGFPESARLDADRVAADLSIALATRPELKELQALRSATCVDASYANNLLLPKLDVKGFAGQDLGGATSSKGDKTPFELQLGVYAEVPIQRREAVGKIQVAQGKLAQVDAKFRFVSDKIRAGIQDAASAVNAAYDQIIQSRETVRLNEESLRLGELAFKEGDIDLLALNIYETSVANARLELLEANHKYFSSLATYASISRSLAFESINP